MQSIYKMKTVFLDTNIVLDVFLTRNEFNRPSAAIWKACETGKVVGMVSAMTFNNMYYIYAKSQGRPKALDAVRLVLAVCKIVPLDEKILRLAADNPGSDFEDAIQFYSALEANASCIVTRDANDFAKGQVPILSPGEFLATL